MGDLKFFCEPLFSTETATRGPSLPRPPPARSSCKLSWSLKIPPPRPASQIGEAGEIVPPGTGRLVCSSTGGVNRAVLTITASALAAHEEAGGNGGADDADDGRCRLEGL